MNSRTITRKKRKTQETRQIESLLNEALPDADIEAYRYNSACIRLRVISEEFEGKTRVQRERKILPLLRKLPDDTRAELTMLLLLTPNEAEKSSINAEFEDPTPSRL